MPQILYIGEGEYILYHLMTDDGQTLKPEIYIQEIKVILTSIFANRNVTILGVTWGKLTM